ncbi:DUF222 domain-containing protein [Gordonia sp. NPDC003424]
MAVESLADWWREASPWPDLSPRFTGFVDAEDLDAAEVNDLVGGFVSTTRGRSFLAWQDYRCAAELHHRLVGAEPREDDLFQVDGVADCAARIAIALAISQNAAEKLLHEALALRDRLPLVAQRLRNGRISAERIGKIIARTDLIDGTDCAALVDAEIAAELDAHRGGWSAHRLQLMVDRIVFRHDPQAVREARRRAKNARRFWTKPTADGMAQVAATMSAEDAQIAAAAVTALATSVCGQDPRTTGQRESDASFALLTGNPFECLCGLEECTAQIPEPGTTTPPSTAVVIHVVADASTVAGTAEHAGFLAGHGVIGDEQVRDLVARPDAVLRPLVPTGTPMNPDGSYTLLAHSAANPYRPSTALDTFVRVRDGFSVIPGDGTSAFDADLDHVAEFDHIDPAVGGQTTAENINAKGRLGHLLKTFGLWVDDQMPGPTGATVTEFTTPEGLIIPGEPETLENLLPGLRRIRFKTPPAPDDPQDHGAPPQDSTPPARTQSRVASKHARRRHERERNRRRRENQDKT